MNCYIIIFNNKSNYNSEYYKYISKTNKIIF